MRTNLPKAYTKAETSKTSLSGLENSKSETNSETQESAYVCTTVAGVLMNGMMTGVPLDGTKVGHKRLTLTQAHFTWRFGCHCHQ